MEAELNDNNALIEAEALGQGAGGKGPNGGSSTADAGKGPNGDPSGSGTNGKRRLSHSIAGGEGEELAPEPKKLKFDLKHVRREKEENDWEIPAELAEFFQYYCKTHIADADMATDMENFPPPKNLDSVVPVLDPWMKKALTDEGKNTAREQDTELHTIQKKFLNVMGPLGVAWASLELHRANQEKQNEEHEDNQNVDVIPNISDICEQLQKAVILVGHGINRVSWFRRVHVLSSIGKAADAKKMLAEEKNRKIFAEATTNELFTKAFDEGAKEELTARRNVVNLLKPTQKKSETKKGTPKQPFSANPFRKGGGSGGSENSFSNHNKNRGSKGNNPMQRRNDYHPSSSRGKTPTSAASGQHALSTRLVNVTKTCTPDFDRNIPYLQGSITSGRENPKVLPELENFNQRFRNSKNSPRVGNPFAKGTCPKRTPSQHKHESKGGKSNRSGSGEHVGQRSNTGSDPQRGSISQQYICNPKRGGPISPNHKSEGNEQECSLPAFQDGGSQGCETSFEKGGLDVQTGSQGCILLSSPEPSIKEICEVQMERDTVRIPMPRLRARTCPKNLHQTHEGTGKHFEEIRHSTSNLSRRHPSDSVLSRRDKDGKRHSTLSVSPSGAYNKPEKISLESYTATGVSWSSGRQPTNGILSSRNQNSEADGSLSGDIHFSIDFSPEVVLLDRKAGINSCSSNSSPTSTQVPSTNEHKSSKRREKLRICHTDPSRGPTGIEVVGGKPEASEREPTSPTAPRDDNMLGRSEDWGLGSCLPSRFNGRSLVRGGSQTSHQHSRVDCGRIGDQNFHEAPETFIDSLEDRQHNCVVISSEDGRDPKSDYDRDSKTNLGIPSGSGDHDYCRMDSFPSEHNSRLGIEEHQGLGGMEAFHGNFPKSVPTLGSTRHRPFCVQNISSSSSILQLESGPRVSSSRCFPTNLGARLPIRLPSVLSDNSGPKTGGKARSGENDIDHPLVANSTLVPFTPVYVNPSSVNLTSERELASKPHGRSTSLIEELLSEPSGLASFRDRLSAEGFSSSSQNLILNARAKGTTKNYESTWKKWVLWCSGRNLDPFTCSVKDIADFLASLHDKNLAYRYIGVFRSAISAYHEPLACNGSLVAAGRHPYISKLMSGVHNLNPPQPKYGFTWDVEAVLNLFKKWPLTLTSKQLSIKTVTLLSLIGIPRGAEIHQFDLKFLSPFTDRNVFELNGTVKNVREGEKPKPIVFHSHEEDPKLCPVKCLNEYISMTDPWRKAGEPSALFLSYISPHKPITKARLAGWLKEALMLAEVDTTVFKAHSVRGAASSMALVKGLSVKEVVQHGNWSRESTWQRFYHREVQYPSKKFQDSLLNKL
jgi:hypothetical protein